MGTRAISTFIDPSLNWDSLQWFKENTHMPILLKGVQCAEDAILAVEHGMDGIVCSNHGGRQIDTCRSGVEVLQNSARCGGYIFGRSCKACSAVMRLDMMSMLYRAESTVDHSALKRQHRACTA